MHPVDIPNVQNAHQMAQQINDLPLQDDDLPIDYVPRRNLAEDQVPQNVEFLGEGRSEKKVNMKNKK